MSLFQSFAEWSDTIDFFHRRKWNPQVNMCFCRVPVKECKELTASAAVHQRWFGSLFPVTGLNSRWKLEFLKQIWQACISELLSWLFSYENVSMSYWNESQLHVEAFSKLNCWNLHQTKEHTCFLVEESLLRSKSEMIVFSEINLRRLVNLYSVKLRGLGFRFPNSWILLLVPFNNLHCLNGE